MKELEKIIEQYKKDCARKERLLKPFHDKKRGIEDLKINEHTEMLILEAEIRQLKEVIEDLEYYYEMFKQNSENK